MNNKGVIKFQAPFEKMKDYDLTPEVRLFKSIILQAIIDASNNSSLSKARKLEIEAKNWIFGNKKYFQEICYKANCHPDHVIKTALKVIRLNRRDNYWITYSLNNNLYQRIA